MLDTQPEVWLRGPVPGYDAAVMPVVHSLLQVREDLAKIGATVSHGQLWTAPGGAAPVGFHIAHIGGSTDRLFTYARGRSLDPAQLAALKAEATLMQSRPPLEQLLARADALLVQALAELRTIGAADLTTPRAVGRAALPSTVGGLLFHAAEHATRHAGQALTTARIVADSRSV